MILDHRPAKADDLIARVLLHPSHVGGDVRPQGMKIGLGRHFPFQRLNFALDIADIPAQAPQMLDDDVFGLPGREAPTTSRARIAARR